MRGPCSSTEVRLPFGSFRMAHSWCPLVILKGKSFGGYIGNFAAESQKPLIVTEVRSSRFAGFHRFLSGVQFGIDAYNDPCGWNENLANGVIQPSSFWLVLRFSFFFAALFQLG